MCMSTSPCINNCYLAGGFFQPQNWDDDPFHPRRRRFLFFSWVDTCGNHQISSTIYFHRLGDETPSGFRPVFVCRRSSCHSSKPGKGSSRCPWVWSKRRMWHGLVLGQRGKDWEGAGIGVLLVGWQLVATFYWTLRMDGHLQFYCVGICGIIGITLAGLRNS